MTIKTVRKIVHIDEEKCNGCGACVPSCAEGALQLVDGKARLVSEIYCDGLGACLGECPQGAITIEERQAVEFDEEATRDHLEAQQQARPEPVAACPSVSVAEFGRQETAAAPAEEAARQPSTLGHWPVQLSLVPPKAPFLQGADLLLAADCVPFCYPDFHRDFLKDHALLVACPKLDDYQAHLQKLAAIFSQSAIKSLTIVHMEVPCCSGLVHMVKQALQLSGKDIPVREVTVCVRGEVLAAS